MIYFKVDNFPWPFITGTDATYEISQSRDGVQVLKTCTNQTEGDDSTVLALLHGSSLEIGCSQSLVLSYVEGKGKKYKVVTVL